MSTGLDRDSWGQTPCSMCHARRAHMVIDKTPDQEHGTYVWSCWQCYWLFETWRLGPIVNAGIMWDQVDYKRQFSEPG